MKSDRNRDEAAEPFVRSIGERGAVVRKALSDERVQNAFVAALDEDPRLIEVLAKVTPDVGNVAADWSCCRGNRLQLDLEEWAESLRRRQVPPKSLDR